MNDVVIEQIKRELLERLCRHRLTLDTVQEIGSCFNDFASALGNNDVRSLLRATTIIHDLVSKLTGTEDVEAVCDRLQGLIPQQIKAGTQSLTRRELFFVWIGSIDSRSIRNISLWQRANPGYQAYLWFDSRCLLASHYRRLLRERGGLKLSTNSDVIKFQNRAYAYIKSRIADGQTFDESLIQFLVGMGLDHVGRKLELELEKARRLYQGLSHYFRLCDVQDYANTIMDEEFRHYYFREIVLRGNLAAASDILRLHVIQLFGGLYVDCDTLPCLDHVFVRTGAHCRQHNISFAFIDLLKSEMYMEKIGSLIEFPEFNDEPHHEAATRQSNMQAITEHLHKHYREIVSLIRLDVHALTLENAFRPLDEIWLFPEGIRLTGDPYNTNCFNNNVIIANPHSKVIRIILLEMRRRYRYLGRMGAVDIASEMEVPFEESYWGRLLNYRFDAMDHQDNVTVILTGPGLIFEVLSGLGFSLLKLKDQVSPLSLSYTLYSEKIGITFMDQTLYTYDHSRSSWMRTFDGHAIVV